MANNRATKSGFAAEAQRKVSSMFVIWFLWAAAGKPAMLNRGLGLSGSGAVELA